MLDIKHFTKPLQNVQALFLVGSGATGFSDLYSDLDVLIVTKNPEDVVTIHQKITEYLQSTHSILKMKTYRHEDDIFVTCSFFDHYLELDLGIWSFQKIRATKPHWTVIFDKGKHVSEKLSRSGNTLPQKDIEETIYASLTMMWPFFRGAAVAIKRGHYIKALKDIDVIRNHIIEIVCLREGKAYDFDKSIDQIDNAYFDRLKKTYEISMDDMSIQQTLFDVMHLLFEVMNKPQDEEIERNRKMIEDFLTFFANKDME
ncbi:hypothetical protein G4V62_13560 [Bacillaceae bacterium SIJ1]|uniref:nucleotidyltransferase domain-containing protein n=1 Tax=Litoribacterium kuwaitense TaxID=1398745 RepID=UPI0013ED9288|nr:nucleotidyltransferase domain-containing protein [Litoribacterium kuwaitense]NGP45922.1 hypothetical protein [Litoribacterium kuwaitense]